MKKFLFFPLFFPKTIKKLFIKELPTFYDEDGQVIHATITTENELSVLNLNAESTATINQTIVEEPIKTMKRAKKGAK